MAFCIPCDRIGRHDALVCLADIPLLFHDGYLWAYLSAFNPWDGSFIQKQLVCKS